MIREYPNRDLTKEPPRDPAKEPDRWRLKVSIPGYPAGYVAEPHNALLPRWKRMGLVERVDVKVKRPARAGARVD